MILVWIFIGIILFLVGTFLVGVVAAIAKLTIRLILYFIGLGITVLISVFFFMIGWSIAGYIFSKAAGG